MDRRKFLRNGAAAGIGLSSINIVSTTAGTTSKAAKETDAADFPLLETTIDILQQKMQSGEHTSQSITKLYLKRIADIDKKGPTLNAVIELNPDVLTIAAQMDAERKAGKTRGPLHGIPILIKDNIKTGDKMQTTAGALALEGHKAAKDAFIVLSSAGSLGQRTPQHCRLVVPTIGLAGCFDICRYRAILFVQLCNKLH